MIQIDPARIMQVVAVEWPAWEPGGRPGEMLLSSWWGETETLLIKLKEPDQWREHHMLVPPDWIEEAHIEEGEDDRQPVALEGWLRVIAFVAADEEEAEAI